MAVVERQIGMGQEVVVEGVRVRLRPGLMIVGKPDESGQVKLGPGVKIDKEGNVTQNGHMWKSWATPPVRYSSEAGVSNDPAVRELVKDTPLYGIPLFTPPSKRFG